MCFYYGDSCIYSKDDSERSIISGQQEIIFGFERFDQDTDIIAYLKSIEVSVAGVKLIEKFELTFVDGYLNIYSNKGPFKLSHQNLHV